MTTLRFAERLRDLVDNTDVVLSDIWGVVHNGLESFPEACAALHAFRQQGGTVILITNAPRPADSVQRQLRKLDVADETYDAIVSSGDLTRNFVAGHSGQKMFWVGPERDNSIYRGLDPLLAPGPFFQDLTQLIRSAALFLSLSPPTREYFRLLGEIGETEFASMLAQEGEALEMSRRGASTHCRSSSTAESTWTAR